MKKLTFFFLLFINFLYAEDIYKIAINHAPPYRIIGDNNYSGIYVDIINEVAKEANIKIKFVELPFVRALEEMKLGNIDIMLGPNKDAEREAYMYFINEYPFPKESKAFYYIESDNVIKKYDDLYNKKIEVLRGAKYFDKFDDDVKLQKNEITDYLQAIRKVEANRADIVIIPELQGDYLLKENKSFLFKSPYLVEGNPSFVSLSKKSKNFYPLKDKLFLGLKKVNEKGIYKKILSRYKD